jgi:trimethylamine--corrinoid protein Co-methyltransferase
MIDRMQTYSKSELNLVHDASMDILENTGIGFHHSAAIKLFRKNGFRIDDSRVFITENDVIQALESVPERFRIHSRNPLRSVWVGGDNYVLLPTGGAPNVANSDGQQRPATLADFQTCCKLVQTSTQLDMTDSLMVQPNDLPPLVAHLDLLLNTIVICDKPFLVGFDSRYSVDNTIAMAQIVSGGRNSLKKKTAFASIISPTSPLQYNDDQTYAIIQLAKHRQPMVITNLIMAGMSGPLTLPGLMALLNAEILAGLVLSQLVGPGTPVAYGSTSAPMDMKTTISAVGAPETCVIASATVQLAQFYRLPCRTGGILTDAHVPDAQALAEGTLLMSTAIRNGAHFIIHACGQISSFMALSFEKWLIDEEVCQMIRTVMGQVPVTAETLDVDTIKSVGVGGEYLTHPTTYERFRSLSQNGIFNRRAYSDWFQRGANRAEDEAAVRLAERLEGYEKPLIDEGLEKELRDYVARQKAEILKTAMPL